MIYYKGAVGAIMVYDITSTKSFDKIKSQWYNELKNFADPNIIIMLIGNKCDLESQRQVSKADATTFAKDNGIVNYHIGIAFMETSAKKDKQVSSAFEKMAERLIELKYLYNNNRSTKAEKKDVTKNININQTIKGGVENIKGKIQKCCQ